MPKYLIHMGKEIISDKINDYPPFAFPPGEAVMIPDDFIAGKIVEHKRLEGLVEIEQTGTQNGFPVFDVEGAKKKAAEALKKARREMVLNYIKTQREDRIAASKPPLPPSPVVQKIIEEDGWNLEAEGISLMGAGFKIEDKSGVNSVQIEQMQRQIDTLSEMVKALAEQNKLLTERAGKKGVQ